MLPPQGDALVGSDRQDEHHPHPDQNLDRIEKGGKDDGDEKETVDI
jgi:hypothetical protein